MATYSISDLGRREILLMSAVAASFGLSGWTMPAGAETKLRRTPEQILGPFYPLSEMPQTTDLTRLPGRPGRAEGQILNVMGKVLNSSRRACPQCQGGNVAGQFPWPVHVSERPKPSAP